MTMSVTCNWLVWTDCVCFQALTVFVFVFGWLAWPGVRFQALAVRSDQTPVPAPLPTRWLTTNYSRADLNLISLHILRYSFKLWQIMWDYEEQLSSQGSVMASMSFIALITPRSETIFINIIHSPLSLWKYNVHRTFWDKKSNTSKRPQHSVYLIQFWPISREVINWSWSVWSPLSPWHNVQRWLKVSWSQWGKLHFAFWQSLCTWRIGEAVL